MGACFFFIYFLGKLPLSPLFQGLILVSVCAFPISVLGTLPTAVLSDITHLDVKKSGKSMEGMYFSSRSIMIKLGSTVGILIFASLTVLGKDPGNDLGIRLTGFIGFALSIIASILFSRYKEKDVLEELKKLS
jgi:GPH family glycoside/pentoside/hexuronide:cation symporter